MSYIFTIAILSTAKWSQSKKLLYINGKSFEQAHVGYGKRTKRDSGLESKNKCQKFRGNIRRIEEQVQELKREHYIKD